MTDFQKCSLIIRAAGVLATLLAVAVAIWGERIQQLWTKPQLQVGLAPPSLNTTARGDKCWYYLISVTNTRSSSPAENVRVLLTRMFKKGPDGLWQEQRFSGPTQVTWRWPQMVPLYATIGPQQLSTFGRLCDDSDAFSLRLYWNPNNLTSEVKPDDPTRLEFQAVSDTSESEALTVQVAWDGEWTEGSEEMEAHCIVMEVEP